MGALHAPASPGEKLGYAQQRTAACAAHPGTQATSKACPGPSAVFGGRPKIEFAREDGANSWDVIVHVIGVLRVPPQLQYTL